MPEVILGISAYYHDSAAAILVDGHIVTTAQEERFSRIKHDDRFPALAIAFVLDKAKIGIPPRNPEGKITQDYMNLALAIQQVTEEIILLMAKHANINTIILRI